MSLPPAIEIALPSVADGSALACRLYFSPSIQSRPETSSAKCAIVAHPYAPLGGDFNDPVVLLVAEELCNAGFVVMTFNFRGATESRRAATSWTSKPEKADYSSVAYFLTHVMLTRHGGALARLRVVLSGYSYGSMIASSTCPVSDLVEEEESNSPYDSIKRRARELAKNLPHSGSLLQEPLNPASQPPVIETHYLLVSPLLPPISSFLTLFAPGRRDDWLQTHKTLAIYGSNDHFTASRKLRQWTARIGIQGEEIEGGDHFWLDINAVQMLRQTIHAWAT